MTKIDRHSLALSRGARGLARAWAFALLAALLASGCEVPTKPKSDAEPPGPAKAEQAPASQPEQSRADAGTLEPPTQLEQPEQPPPQVPPEARAWPQNYRSYGLKDGFALALIRPTSLLADLERGKQLFEKLDPATAQHLSNAFERGLQDLVKLLQPGEWTAQGLASNEPILLQLALRPGPELDSTLAAILEAPELGDALVLLAGAEDLVRQVPLVLRLLLPVEDPGKARAFLSGALSALASDPPQPMPGYDAVFDINGSFAIGITEQTAFLGLDMVFLPWFNADDQSQHLAASRRVAAELAGACSELDSTVLLPPRSEQPELYISVDLRGLNRLNTLLLLTAAASKPNRIDALRSAARVSEALLGDASPYCTLSLESGSAAGIIASAQFCEPKPALADAFRPQPFIDASHAMLAAGFSPIVAAFDGPWVEAGMSVPKGVDLNLLLQALTVENGLLPLMVPVWGPLVPHLLWRDLVPATARYVRLEQVDRIQAFADTSINAALPLAIGVIDVGAEASLHQHGLACLTQRRPVQGKCADERIELGRVASTRYGQQLLHYLLQQRDDSVLAVLGPSEELVRSLSMAPLEKTRSLGELRIDFKQLVASPLASELTEPLLMVAQMLDQARAQIIVHPHAIDWQLELSPPHSVTELAMIAGPAVLDYVRRGKEVEAFIKLEGLGVASLAHFESSSEASFPLAAQVLCSKGGQPMGVAVSPADTDWSQAPWSRLGFSIPHPHVYRYCYQSSGDGSGFAAWAEAAIDGEAIDSRFCIHSQRAELSEMMLSSVRRLALDELCAPTQALQP